MTTVRQFSLAAGEISPALYGRCDTSKYQAGLRTCRNFQIARHGGGSSRPGTTFVAEVKDSTKPVRLIPFVVSDAITYMLEFGDYYMRIYQGSSQLQDLFPIVSGITKANPAVVTTSLAHGLSTGDEIVLTAYLGTGIPEIQNRHFKVASVTSTTFQLKTMAGANFDSTPYTTFSGNMLASRIYTVVSPFAAADLATLQYVESADVMTFAHPNYPPTQLSRYASFDWRFATMTFAPKMTAPTGLTGPGGGTYYTYVVTAVSATTGEESLPSAYTTAANGLPNTLTWTAVADTLFYNVYRQSGSSYGLIGTSNSTTFIDTGFTPNISLSPPTVRNPFIGAGNYPSAVAYYQQRLCFANTVNAPQTFWSSRPGQFYNFGINVVSQDNDAVTFTLVGNKVNAIRHIPTLSTLLLLTQSGEWNANGDSSGSLTPTGINLKQYSYNGSSTLRPIVVGTNVLYVQARGSVVRDLGFDFVSDSYKGNDLTMFSSHLVDNYTITDWAYQQIPQSILWMSRSDGAVLGLTYVREQELLAWHRHDFPGNILFGTQTYGICENVCSVPGGTEDIIYFVVNRNITGRGQVRYIERLSSRSLKDIVDYVGMDCAVTYDGRINITNFLTLTGGTTWAYTETLTLTSSGADFDSSYVGAQIQLTGTDGQMIRFTVTGYTSSSVVTGTANRTVPASLQGTIVTKWSRCYRVLSGLGHLEGQAVSVLADGYVVASPNNPAYPVYTVVNGSITLDRPYAVIHVGLPITCDIETLDMDSAQTETMADKNKLIGKVTVQLEKSRGMWVGAQAPDDSLGVSLSGLEELKVRTSEGYDQPVNLVSDKVEVVIDASWNSNGRIFIRHVDPVPLTVLSFSPSGYIPIKGTY